MLMTYFPTKMKRIEFFTDPRTGEAMFQVVGEITARQLTETDREVIEELLRISDGNCQFEDVPCPRKAECKYYRIICHPTISTALSDREKEVMEMIFHNRQAEEIADSLFLSIHTVRNHRKNALKKLGLHSTEEFIDFAHRIRLFE